MTRIRPDKQIMRAPGQGYILRTDAAGELQYALLSAFTGGGGNSTTGIVSIDSVTLNGNILVLAYTDATGTGQQKTVDLTPFAADVKLTGAIVQNPAAGTYVLELSESDGTKVSVNLSDLIPVATQSNGDIILSGNGTPATPLMAELTPALKRSMNLLDTTAEFEFLRGGNSITLPKFPDTNKPVRVFRNGIRITTDEWSFGSSQKVIVVSGVTAFGDNGLESETIVVDFYALEDSVVVPKL